MALRQLTDDELNTVIFNSLTTIVVFGARPGDAGWDNEVIPWRDLLDIPPVTKSFLYDHTRIVTYALDPGHLIPTLHQGQYFAHVDGTARESVARYRTFLRPRLIVKEV